MIRNLFTAMITVLCVNVMAQDCPDFFPLTKGQEIVMESYSDKGKLTSKNIQKVMDIQGNKYILESEGFDEKNKSVYKGEFDIICEKDKLKINMSSFMNPATMDAYKNMDLKIETNYIELPVNLSIGQALADANFVMEVLSEDVTMMTVKTNITNRKVEAQEDITTPLGTFKAYKITYDTESKVGFVNVSGKAAEWYVPKVGMVKSESYNKKGKLTGYTVRTK